MQVWTLTFEAIVGGKQRGPLATVASQCPLDQLLSHPGSSSGVEAQTPGHQQVRARRPTASRLRKTRRAPDGWTWHFPAPPPAWCSQVVSLLRPPLAYGSANFCQPPRPLRQHLDTSHEHGPETPVVWGFMCACLPAEHFITMRTHWCSRAFGQGGFLRSSYTVVCL